jgi:hypothetical protein
MDRQLSSRQQRALVLLRRACVENGAGGESDVASDFGSQSMAGQLKRVLMRRASSAMRRADAKDWHYGPGFDPARAAAEHDGW